MLAFYETCCLVNEDFEISLQSSLNSIIWLNISDISEVFDKFGSLQVKL